MTQGTERSYTTLDARTLGRPVHLLDKYTERLRKELGEYFQQGFNRRYRAQFEVGPAAFDMTPSPDARRWLTHASAVGRIGFAIDRNLLLCMLTYRYGSSARTDCTEASNDLTQVPHTATEERLAQRLAHQLTCAAAATIEALQPEADEPAAPQLAPTTRMAFDDGWTLRLALHERVQALQGTVTFRFDEAWVARLLRGLSAQRDKLSKPLVVPGQPLYSRLQLTLSARLLEKSISLGRVLDLKVDDILPVTLGATDVLIEESRLFTASVAEHKGKLCLTCFENVE